MASSDDDIPPIQPHINPPPPARDPALPGKLDGVMVAQIAPNVPPQQQLNVPTAGSIGGSIAGIVIGTVVGSMGGTVLLIVLFGPGIPVTVAALGTVAFAGLAGGITGMLRGMYTGAGEPDVGSGFGAVFNDPLVYGGSFSAGVVGAFLRVQFIQFPWGSVPGFPG
jgi:hypothetical protein